MPVFPNLQKMVAQSDVAFTAYEIEARLKPLPEQFALGPGDYAISMAGEAKIDDILYVMEILDPDEARTTYPDTLGRLANSYVLCRYQLPLDPDHYEGWFARCRMIPLSAEEYAEVVEAFAEEHHTSPPQWLTDRWRDMMDRASDNDPDLVPRQVTCPQCQSRKVELHLRCSAEFDAPVGERKVDGKTVYTPLRAVDFEWKFGGHLHCTECGVTADLAEDEVDSDIVWPG